MSRSRLPEENLHNRKSLGRRRLLQALAAAGGAAVASTVRIRDWRKPVVEVGVLPAFATVSRDTEGGSGTYTTEETGRNDPGGHGNFIEQTPGEVIDNRTVQLQLWRTGSSYQFTMKGEAPFVNVSGPVEESGGMTFLNGTGSGTVAGISNVGVSLFSYISGGALTNGLYTMGFNGELPGGQPFDLFFEGQKNP